MTATFFHRFGGAIILIGATAMLFFLASAAKGRDFIVESDPDGSMSAKFDEIKRELAIEWYGAEAPPFKTPVRVRVEYGVPSGYTKYGIEDGYVVGGIQVMRAKTMADLYANTARHEIMHLLNAEWFGDGIPRWFNEGMATCAEGPSMHKRRRQQLYKALTSRPAQGFSFNAMMSITHNQPYPRKVQEFYAQSYSVCDFLVSRLGKQGIIRYGEDAIWNRENEAAPWTAATQKHLNIVGLKSFQDHWVAWLQNPTSSIATTSVAQMGST